MTFRTNKVFITRSILKDGQDLLEKAGFEVTMHENDRALSYEELLEKAKNFEALITMLDDKIDQHFLIKNSHLKVISNYAVGFNNIDIVTASNLGIPIGNTPDVLTDATAEVALGLILSTSRNFQSSHSWAKEGLWTGWSPTANLGHSLKDKKLAIIGFGRIGQRLAEMAYHALKMQVAYFSRHEVETSFPAKRMELDDLLSESDVISLHLPLTKDTHHLINSDKFILLKPNAILINTARGEIIDQDALTYHLKNNPLFKAGLDVTDPEPLSKDSELYRLSNAFVLPHIGSASFEARKAMSLIAAQNIIAGLTNKELIGWVNKKNLHP